MSLHTRHGREGRKKGRIKKRRKEENKKGKKETCILKTENYTCKCNEKQLITSKEEKKGERALL